MATIGTQSFSRLVCVRKNKTGEAVDVRRALADVAGGDKVLANFRFITPQLEALRVCSTSALSGGSVVLAGAGGTGKSSLMYTLARLLTVDYPSADFTNISDCLRDVYLVRAIATLRTSNRHWLLALPNFSNGDFAYAMRGAINGALLSSDSTSDFVPNNGTLAEEYAETAEYLRRQGNFDGILIVGDQFDVLRDSCISDPEGDNAKNLKEFTAFCASCSFPVLFLTAVERDLSSLSVEEEDFLLGVFQKVQPLTLLGKDGEWEDVVSNYVLEHPDPQAWSEAVEYRDFHTVTEGTTHQGLYAGNSEKWLSDMVVCGAYPLHPAALFALPRVAMNLTSSAKTAFRFFTDDAPGGLAYFLNNYAVVQPNGRLHLYTIDWLCTYFEKVIQKDPHNNFYTSALQAAILAAGDVPQSRRILRLIMIMQLIGHDRLRPTTDTILWALHLGEREERNVRRSLELLLQKKAVEYSEATKEYLLPVPRQEVNVPQVIQRNRNRMRSQLDLRQELQSGLPTLRVRALGYNKTYYTDRCGIMRAFLSSDIQDASAFFEQVDETVGSVYPYRGDFLFAIIIPESEDDMNAVIERIKEGKYNHPRLMMVVPKNAHCFANDILEVRTLERMLSLESPFSDSTTAAHAKVSSMLSKVTERMKEYADEMLAHRNMLYYYQGEVMEFNSDAEVEDWLDERMATLVGVPPLIASTDLMSLGDSGVARRHRQRLVAYLMATRDSIALRSDVRDIRTMVDEGLVKTSILREAGVHGFWSHFELNENIPDEGLGKVFNSLVAQIKATGEDNTVVQVSSLLRPWLSAPNAFTPALMEMLLAVVLWHWHREVRLFKNNLRAQAETRPELLQSVPHSAQAVSDMVADPADWVINFCEATVPQKRFLQGIFRIAGVEPKGNGVSLWGQAAGAILAWYEKLPPVVRENEVINKQELQRFNRFFVMAPKQPNRWRDLIEVQLPRLLGAPPNFSWDRTADVLVQRLESMCTEFSMRAEEMRQYLQQNLNQIFAIPGVQLSWSESADAWIQDLPEGVDTSVWQVEYDALRLALTVPEEERLATLLSALGCPDLENWKQDCTQDVIERMEMMRLSLDLCGYTRGYRYSDNNQVARQLCCDVLRASSLSEEGIQNLLEEYIQALAWPESFVSDADQLAELQSVVINNDQVGMDEDWLNDDYIEVFKGVSIVDDRDDSDDLYGLYWPLGEGDVLADVTSEPHRDEFVAPPVREATKEEKRGFSLASLVSGFTRARAAENKAKEEYAAAAVNEPLLIDEAENLEPVGVSAEDSNIEDVDLSEGGSFAGLNFMTTMVESPEMEENEPEQPQRPEAEQPKESDEELDEVTLEWL